jgi:hypothetical protein
MPRIAPLNGGRRFIVDEVGNDIPDRVTRRDEYGDLIRVRASGPVRLRGPQVVTPENPLPDFRDRYSVIHPAIHNWSHKPEPLFRGTGPLYFGLELEVSFYEETPGARCAQWFLRDLGYLKHDSSVEGFEIVTHPMSYPWFMRNFPFEMLERLSDAGGRIAISTNGLHVHVSRAGFSGASHAYRWMKLLYRNAGQVERIAGRHSRWATFDRNTRGAQFVHLKNTILRDKGLYPLSDDEDREQAGMSHYAAINNLPRETYELRVFAATLKPELLKSRVQLVAASVEYTRKLRAKDIARGKAWDWPVFATWVTEHKRTYPDLAEAVTPVPPVPPRVKREQAEAERAVRREERRRRENPSYRPTAYRPTVTSSYSPMWTLDDDDR